MYPLFMPVFNKNMKKVKNNLLKTVIFSAVKNRCTLHRRVFVMKLSNRQRNSQETSFNPDGSGSVHR